MDGIDPVRNCLRCKGSGKTEACMSIPERACVWCGGKGTFSAPNIVEIAEALKGRGGKLRSTKPKDRRAAYVWRLARFHGGKDVTMPMMAQLDVTGDPYVNDVLEPMSQAVAKQVFGSDIAGAMRWHRAFYG